MNSEKSGPKPRFDEVQMKKALKLIGKNEPIGRKRLADRLGVGEGSMRTILDRLKGEGFVSSTARGHVLTSEGEEELEEGREFLRFAAGDLTVGDEDVAVKVESVADKVNLGIAQRDEAIKVGAEGATVFVFEDDDLKLPDSDEEIDDDVKSTLLDFFDPSEGDIIVVGTADDEITAERGGLAAADSLLE